QKANDKRKQTNGKGGFAHPPSLSGLPPQGGQITTTTNGFLARSANFSTAKTKTTQGAQNGKDKGI
ncbi:MAG: hypothetical protein LBN20_02540, partial [Endomicrobium sp.]|nr:hypothetical protein [Endomicrobium sp.]